MSMELRVTMDATLPLPKEARDHAQALEAALKKIEEIIDTIEKLGGYCYMSSKIVQGRKRKVEPPAAANIWIGQTSPNVLTGTVVTDDPLHIPAFLKGVGAS